MGGSKGRVSQSGYFKHKGEVNLSISISSISIYLKELQLRDGGTTMGGGNARDLKGADDKVLVQLFQRSLTGPALRWFTSIEPSRLRTWDDLAVAFLDQDSVNCVFF